MSNPANKIINRAIVRNSAFLQKVTDGLQEQLSDASPSDVSRIVNEVFRKYDVEKEFQEIILDSIVGAVKFSIDIPNVTAFKGYYLKNVKAVDDIKLSSKIHDLSRTNEISSLIKQSLTVSGKWQTVARDLVKNDITQAELPKYLKEMLDLSSKAAGLSKDTEIAQEYRRALAHAQRSVDRLISPDTSTLRRAYRDVIEATQSATTKQLDSAIERAIMFKARSNAQRLAATETSRAYGNARILEIKSDEDAVGIQVSLIGDHRDIGCICEYIVEQDWGWGPGAYPFSKLPEYPFHPWCDCNLDPLYRGDIEDFDDTTDPDSKYDWEYNKLFIDEDVVEV